MQMIEILGMNTKTAVITSFIMAKTKTTQIGISR